MVLRFGPASEWFVWPIPAVMAPFVGVFYPISTLPHWMQFISYLLPPTYVFEGMRAVLKGGGGSESSLLWGGSLAVVSIAVAYRIFARVYRHAVRNGLIARYSAETLS
jgi:ABC-2 type transport system permease protein